MDFFFKQRKLGDSTADTPVTCKSFSTSTIFHKKTKCIGNITYTYVVYTQRYGLIFKENFYSYSDVYIDLGPILSHLRYLFEKNTKDSWNRAVVNCPTIKNLFEWHGGDSIYHPSIVDHSDYLDVRVADNGEEFIPYEKHYYLETSCRGKVPYPNNEFENTIFEELKQVAFGILNELKQFRHNELEETKLNWMEIAALCFLGIAVGYGVSELAGMLLPVDIGDIDTGESGFEFTDGESIGGSNADMNPDINDGGNAASIAFGHAPNDGTYSITNQDVSISTESGHPKGSFDVFLHHGDKYIDFQNQWIKIQGKSRFFLNGNWYVIK